MKVYDYRLGRLGNAIFRYFASSLFRILYNAERTYNESEATCHFNDGHFNNWISNLHGIDNNQVYGFYGYYQHDVFRKYINKIKFWILTHPDELLYTDGNDDKINYFNYNSVAYKASDILPKTINKVYKVVVHVRLEDFIHNKDVIHPLSIKKILEEIGEKDICIVVNQPKTELENKYLDYFKKLDYNVTIEYNDVITDYQIMCNAEILICSYSTLSWCAALMSETVTCVYMPDYPTNEHATFKKPIDNTILYKYQKCGKEELELFFFNNNLPETLTIHENEIKSDKLDSYCAVDCKRQPITKRILEYIGSIPNGFYLEAGAYDGILQSNTKFLEEEYGWSGILIEPSPKVFQELVKNRPDNISINKCLVSCNYGNKTIMGAFDNGPMSSVNNMRNIENAELISVECDTLENILDELLVAKIDFMTVDTEGYELEVLEGLNLNKYRPTYIMIEVYTQDKDKILTFMENNNYIFLENITNYNKLDNPGWDGTHNDYLFKAL